MKTSFTDDAQFQNVFLGSCDLKFSKKHTKNKSMYPNAHSLLTEARLGPFLAARIRAAVDVLPENKTLGWGPVGTRKIRNPG